MVIHVYHPYRQPDGENYCQAVNGHCSHLCLPAPQITAHSPRISCACPEGLHLLSDGLTCVQGGEYYLSIFEKDFPYYFIGIFIAKIVLFIYIYMRKSFLLLNSRSNSMFDINAIGFQLNLFLHSGKISIGVVI